MYRTLCTHLWTDKKIQRLSIQGKCLFVYLITNPHTHLSGIYYLPKELVSKETGIAPAQIAALFRSFAADHLKLAYFDDETSTVFVVNMFSYQGKGAKNEKCAANHITTLHESYCINLFLERYPTVKQFCSDTLLDTLSDRDTDPSKRCPSVPVLLSSLSSSESGPNLKSNDHSKKKSAREFPEDLICDEKVRSSWASHGIDPNVEFAKFRDYHRARGTRFTDWLAAWRNWARKAIEMKETSHVRPLR